MKSSYTLWENREHWPIGITRIFEKWAQAKLQTISVENGTKTSTVSSTLGDDSAVNDKTFIVIGFLKRRQSDWWVTWTIVVLMTDRGIKQKMYVSVSCHSSASQVTNYVLTMRPIIIKVREGVRLFDSRSV